MKNNISKLALFFTLGLSLAACGTIVNPGEVYLKVKLTGPDAGVEKAEVFTSGRAFAGIDEKLYQINSNIQNYTWTKDPSEGKPNDESMTFATNDGVKVNVDVGITYQIIDAKAFLITYKKEDEEFRGGELRNLVRDTLNTTAARIPLRELINLENSGQTKSGIELIQSRVLEQLNNNLKPKGVMVNRIAFVNGFRLPENIQAGLTAAQESTQAAAKAEQDLKKATAQLKVSQVQAQQSKVEGAALNPLLLRKMELENQRVLYDKWNGQGVPPVPQVVGGNPSILVSPK